MFMMVVVPAIAQGQDRQNPVILRTRHTVRIGFIAIGVAKAVDRQHAVQDQIDPQEAADQNRTDDCLDRVAKAHPQSAGKMMIEKIYQNHLVRSAHCTIGSSVKPLP